MSTLILLWVIGMIVALPVVALSTDDVEKGTAQVCLWPAAALLLVIRGVKKL